jgi:hypothetical protein
MEVGVFKSHVRVTSKEKGGKKALNKGLNKGWPNDALLLFFLEIQTSIATNQNQ